MYATYRRPLAAQAYFLLGDYQATLRTLQDFEPARFRTAGSTPAGAWSAGSGCSVPPLSSSSAAADEARQQYQDVLSQWRRPTRPCSRSSGRPSRGWHGWGRRGRGGRAGGQTVGRSGGRAVGRRARRPDSEGPAPRFEPRGVGPSRRRDDRWPRRPALPSRPPPARPPACLLYSPRWPSAMVAGAARRSRKVRAPSGRLPGNAWAPKGDGQGHRKQTARRATAG